MKIRLDSFGNIYGGGVLLLMDISSPPASSVAGGAFNHPEDDGFAALDREPRAAFLVAECLGGRHCFLSLAVGGAAPAGFSDTSSSVQFDGFRCSWGWEDAEHRGV